MSTSLKKVQNVTCVRVFVTCQRLMCDSNYAQTTINTT